MRRRYLPVLAAVAVAVATAAAGCGGGKKGAGTTTVAASADGTTTAASGALLHGQTPPSIYNDASLFALHEDDMPSGWVVDGGNTRAISNADTARGRGDAYLRQLESWGRITGYATGWVPGPGLASAGPRQVQSSASTFASVGGAEDAFAQGVKEVAASKHATAVERELRVGDEARMWKAQVKAAGGELLSIYELAWRSGRVLATIAVTGDARTATPEATLDFATRQQSRIARQAKSGR